MLNLVESDEAFVEGPTGTFEQFPVHYAEAIVVPAAVGRYAIRPARDAGKRLVTIKAFVKD